MIKHMLGVTWVTYTVHDTERGTQTPTLKPSENANIVVDALLLVLRYALRNPCDVADFLQ